MKTTTPLRVSKDISLDEVRDEDCDTIFHSLKDGEVSRWNLLPFPFNASDAKNIIADGHDRNYLFPHSSKAIRHSSGSLVGMVELHSITNMDGTYRTRRFTQWFSPSADIGFWLKKSFRDEEASVKAASSLHEGG